MFNRIEIMGCSLEASNHMRNFVPTAIMIEFALFQQASTFEMYVNEFTLPQRVELCLNNRIRTLQTIDNIIHQEYPCAPAA